MNSWNLGILSGIFSFSTGVVVVNPGGIVTNTLDSAGSQSQNILNPGTGSTPNIGNTGSIGNGGNNAGNAGTGNVIVQTADAIPNIGFCKGQK